MQRTWFLACLVLVFLFFSLVFPDHQRQFSVKGIDLSHYQTKIDWETVSRQNIRFAFMKSTEGETLRDSSFPENWEQISRTRIRRGAYHFFRPSTPALPQALNFIQTVQLKPGDLPPVLDIEVTDQVSRPVLVNRIRSWLQLIQEHYRVRPIIYTNLKFYYENLAGEFDEHPLWIARYNWWEPPMVVWGDWTFWQYEDKGEIPGIQGPVDLNVFHGTTEDLEQLCIPAQETLSRP